jgi:FtsZ-binding cell division protein ZapB
MTYTKLIERLYKSHDAETLCADAALVIKALTVERDALQSQLDTAIQSSAHWQHQCTELKAENERLKDEREKDAFRLVWAMNWMRMSVHDHGFTKHVLERGGTADYSDCATYIDKCTTATQEADHGIHAKGGQHEDA